MRKYRDGQGAEQRQFKKGYTKKNLKPKNNFKNCIGPLCKVRQKQNHTKARDFRKPVIF